MIRLLQRRLIVPRGDTGEFFIPNINKELENSVAVFTIFDPITHTKIFQKEIEIEGDLIKVAFTHSETVNLTPGKYLWDIKYYQNPQYIDNELIDGDIVDSYYAPYSLPECEIRETADNYLTSEFAPTTYLSPQAIDAITTALTDINLITEQNKKMITHTPIIIDDYWYVWDLEQEKYILTETKATGDIGPQGIQGIQGPQGETGPQGEQGPKGDPGEVTQLEFDALSDVVHGIGFTAHLLDGDDYELIFSGGD